VVSKRGYDPEADLRRPTGSVFCAHGAGFQVPWDEVADYAHMPCPLDKKTLEEMGEELTIGSQGTDTDFVRRESQTGSHAEKFISIEEIDAIFASQRRNRKEDAVSRRKIYKRGKGSENYKGSKTVSANSDNGYNKPGKAPLPKCLFVDGYNMIHAWDELKVLADNNIHGARERLIDICSEYQGMVGGELILVFDAYMAPGSLGSMKKMKNIYVVYTKEAETADQYIEQATKKKAKDYNVTVATSDNIVQLIVMSEGALRMSAREFETEIERARKRLREDYLNKDNKLGNTIITPRT
jgi:predicted RNA-binding protein with PIN domain